MSRTTENPPTTATTTVPYIGCTELAALLGVHNQTIRQWCKRGHLKPTWITPTGQSRFRADLIGTGVDKFRPDLVGTSTRVDVVRDGVDNPSVVA